MQAKSIVAGLPPAVLMLLVGTPLLIAVGQIIFKLAGERLAASGQPFAHIAIDPFFIGACALYGVATFMWVYVLKTVPLSYAYSFMALSYIAVPLLAALWLGEALTLKYALGTGLIMAGLLIAQS